MDTDPIEVEQTFGAPAAAVWKAITDKEQMRQWFFAPMTNFRPEVGFETDLEVEFEDQIFRHQWRVTEAGDLSAGQSDLQSGERHRGLNLLGARKPEVLSRATRILTGWNFGRRLKQSSTQRR